MRKIFFFTAMMLLSVCLFAQVSEGQGAPKKKEVKRIKTADAGDRVHKKPEMRQTFAIEGLSDEQRNSIKELRLAMGKEARQNADLLREKRVQLNTLQKAENPDQTAINSTIDEITALQGQIMKSRADFRTKISGLLTEEQRVAFQQKRSEFVAQAGEGKISERRQLSGESKKFREHKGEGKESGKGKLMKARKAVKADCETKGENSEG
ncbi:MAG: periplasmic heavy metal sensor [Prevotellaceae bacterium]|jgi:Spy/CpxP family protein refolding chaperone|nr:periplasmic heavy metal sensor [Prevotellaceae bacterium]